MICISKFNPDMKYNCDFIDFDKVKLYKDDFHVLITQQMFNKLYKIIDIEEEET